MGNKINGLYTALATPFDAEGQIDEEEWRRLIHFQMAGGADGIVALGTTGESPTLSTKEKERLISIAREECHNKIQLMIGTGTYSTQQTIENTCLAKEMGADSVLIVSPYYNKPTAEGLFNHFKKIADTCQIPLMIYNNPPRTAQNIQTETLLRLAEIPFIDGVKDCSGNFTQLMEAVEKISKLNPTFSVMCGDDIWALPSLWMGADGVISIVGNLLPLQMKALLNAAETDREEARNLHYQLMPFFRAAFIETNPIPIKAAMEEAGFSVGGCRLPLCPLSPENKLKLKQVLEEPILSSFIRQNQSLYESFCSSLRIKRAMASGSATCNPIGICEPLVR